MYRRTGNGFCITSSIRRAVESNADSIGGGPAETLLPNEGLQGEFACAPGAAGRCVVRTVQNDQFRVLGFGSCAWQGTRAGEDRLEPGNRGRIGTSRRTDPRSPSPITIREMQRFGWCRSMHEPEQRRRSLPSKRLKICRASFGLLTDEAGTSRSAHAIVDSFFYVDLEGRILTNLMESMGRYICRAITDGRHVAFMDWTVSANVWQVRGL